MWYVTHLLHDCAGAGCSVCETAATKSWAPACQAEAQHIMQADKNFEHVAVHELQSCYVAHLLQQCAGCDLCHYAARQAWAEHCQKEVEAANAALEAPKGAEASNGAAEPMEVDAGAGVPKEAEVAEPMEVDAGAEEAEAPGDVEEAAIKPHHFEPATTGVLSESAAAMVARMTGGVAARQSSKAAEEATGEEGERVKEEKAKGKELEREGEGEEEEEDAEAEEKEEEEEEKEGDVRKEEQGEAEQEAEASLPCTGRPKEEKSLKRAKPEEVEEEKDGQRVKKEKKEQIGTKGAKGKKAKEEKEEVQEKKEKKEKKAKKEKTSPEGKTREKKEKKATKEKASPEGKTREKKEKKEKKERGSPGGKTQDTPEPKPKHAPAGTPEKANKLTEYSAIIAQLPSESLPTSKHEKGSHSYTVRHDNGAAISVLLRQRAFFVTHVIGRIALRAPAKRHVGWGKDIPQAWDKAKHMAGWP